jgi:hypothetical protein
MFGENRDRFWLRLRSMKKVPVFIPDIFRHVVLMHDQVAMLR